MRTLFLFISLAIIMLSGICVVVFADGGNKRECGSMRWTDKGHGDNKPKEKLKQESNSKDICTLSKDIDQMKTKGAIKDWTQFKESKVYNTSTEEQKKCLKEGFDSPDSNHKKNLAEYEIQYCGTDND